MTWVKQERIEFENHTFRTDNVKLIYGLLTHPSIGNRFIFIDGILDAETIKEMKKKRYDLSRLSYPVKDGKKEYESIEEYLKKTEPKY